MQQLTDNQLKKLKDLATVAAESASVALSKIIDKPVSLEILRARAIEIEKIHTIIALPEERVSAVILPVIGEGGGGSSALISTSSEFRRLVELVIKKPLKPEEKPEELATSVIKETANIIGGAFFSLISNTIKVSVMQSVPEYVEGTTDEVMSLTVAKLDAKVRNEAITFEIDFGLKIENSGIEKIMTHYIFILGFESGQKLLNAS